jgi:hypothetical protein
LVALWEYIDDARTYEYQRVNNAFSANVTVLSFIGAKPL